ncbi:TetR/AcrR family transcriptional regulator [Ochrobactrum sp. GPK 3]|uniref:TetR/AcrR family transcriptional regulator n=1 Tax=Brucella sp. 22210 TaxID=3453892 RepID=UPI0031385EAC
MRRQSKPRQTNEIRKQELIVAALNSIIKNGYLNSTINTISDESGFSRGLINHYFASKEDLLTAAHRYYLQNADDFYRHLMTSTTTGNFQRLIFAASGPFLRDIGYHPLLIHYMSAAWVVPEILALHRSLWGKYRSFIERRLLAVAHDKGMEIDVRLEAITLTQLADGLWLGRVMEQTYTDEECCIILRKWLCGLFGEKPEDYPLRPDFGVDEFPTSAPLPKRFNTYPIQSDDH